jgi:hypothetical protein
LEKKKTVKTCLLYYILMAIVIVSVELTSGEFEKAKEDYGSYIKITIDLEKGLIALGGEYHADAERILLKQGSKQKNIWGGGVNLETGQFETNAIINLRGGINDSTEILDFAIRKKFLGFAKKALKDYVRKS